MIRTLNDMRAYIQADRKRMPISHPFLAALTFSESWSIRRYLTTLRHLEYHKNSFCRYRRLMTAQKFGLLLRISSLGGGDFSFFSIYDIFYNLET